MKETTSAEIPVETYWMQMKRVCLEPANSTSIACDVRALVYYFTIEP